LSVVNGWNGANLQCLLQIFSATYSTFSQPDQNLNHTDHEHTYINGQIGSKFQKSDKEIIS